MVDKSEYLEFKLTARFYGNKADAESIINTAVEVIETEIKPLVTNHNIDNKCDMTVTDKTKR